MSLERSLSVIDRVHCFDSSSDWDSCKCMLLSVSTSGAVSLDAKEACVNISTVWIVNGVFTHTIAMYDMLWEKYGWYLCRNYE